jgi:hypothetical protein
MVSESLAAGGNQSYPDLWVITGNPQYPGYKTPTVSPEPSVEWVARAVHSMGGTIGTLMLQRVP